MLAIHSSSELTFTPVGDIGNRPVRIIAAQRTLCSTWRIRYRLHDLGLEGREYMASTTLLSKDPNRDPLTDDFMPMLRALAQEARARYRWVMGGMLLGLLMAGIACEIIPASYSAQISLVPASGGVEVAPSLSLGAAASALSSLGIQLPRATSQSDFILFPAVLTSSEVAQKVVDNREFLKKLFPREYDPAKDRFRAPHTVGSLIKSGFWRLFGQPGYVPPNANRVRKLLSRKLTVIAATTSTPLTTVIYKNKDRRFAVQFLMFLYHQADAVLRKWQVERAEASAAYLEQKLATVHAMDYRTGLISKLIQQEMTAMLANPSIPFAARVMDGPIVGDRPDSPNPPLWLFIGALLGAAASLALLAAKLFILKHPSAEVASKVQSPGGLDVL